MLFPAVTELLGHLARLPALDEAFEALRQGSRTEEVAGLTQPAKALVAALAATELRTPTLVLVEDERKAASLLEALDFFYRTVNGRSAAPALLLPALDTLPGLGAGPHPEILEARAWTLSRFVSGQCSVVVAPIEATLLRFAPPQFYESLSLALERDGEISLEEVVGHLTKTGYIRTELVEMEGQFSVRGGILDVFPAEGTKPVRIELLGDTVESLREFDPETQRSTGPVNRVILPPLTEFPFAGGADGDGHNGSGSAREKRQRECLYSTCARTPWSCSMSRRIWRKKRRRRAIDLWPTPRCWARRMARTPSFCRRNSGKGLWNGGSACTWRSWRCAAATRSRARLRCSPHRGITDRSRHF